MDGAVEKVGLEFIFQSKQGEAGMKRMFKQWSTTETSINRADREAGRFERTLGKLGRGAGMLKQMATNAMGTAAGMVGFQAISSIFSTMASQIPFLGISLQTMGRTIQTNLIWPLVKDLLPILQRITHWVRDSRLKFVALGTVLVNVFRAAWAVGSAFFGTLKTAAGAFFKSVGAGQLTFRTMIDYFNLMLLKAVFGLLFLEMMLSPTIQKMGAAFGSIWKNWVSPFLEGLGGGLLGMIPVFMEMGGLADRVFGDLAGAASTSLPLLKAIGNFIGVGIVDNLRNLVGVAGALYDGVIKPLFYGISAGLAGASAGGFDLIGSFETMRMVSRKVFGGMLKGIKALAPVFRFAGYVLGKYWSGWIKVITWGYNALIAVGEFFHKGLPDAVASGVTRAKRFFTGLFDGAKSRAAQWMRTIVRVMWDAPRKAVGDFTKNAKGRIQSLVKWVKAIPDSITSLFDKLGEKMENSTFGMFISRMSEALRKAFGTKEASPLRQTKGSMQGPSTSAPQGKGRFLLENPTPVAIMSGGSLGTQGNTVQYTDNARYEINLSGGEVPKSTIEKIKEIIKEAKEESFRAALVKSRLATN